MSQERPHLALGKKLRALDDDSQTRTGRLSLAKPLPSAPSLSHPWHGAASYLPVSPTEWGDGHISHEFEATYTWSSAKEAYTLPFFAWLWKQAHVYFDFLCLVFPNAHLTPPCPKNSNFRLIVVEQHLHGLQGCFWVEEIVVFSHSVLAAMVRQMAGRFSCMGQ